VERGGYLHALLMRGTLLGPGRDILLGELLRQTTEGFLGKNTDWYLIGVFFGTLLLYGTVLGCLLQICTEFGCKYFLDYKL
jgi:hypothetical protein